MRPAYIRVDERYMRIAVDAGDPTNECYRGPDVETWFDLTCIHPNPEGHAAMADLFFNTITVE